MAKSLYTTLEVSENASSDEIKKAYRRLARKYHPDINKAKDAEEKFKEINAAYEILSDANKKAQYDQFGDSMFGGQNFSDFTRGAGAGVDLNDILSQIFGSGGYGKGTGGGFGGFGNFGGFGGHPFDRMPDLDIQGNITIAFETSILGGKYHYQGLDIKIPAGIKDGETIRLKGKGRTHNGINGDLLLKVQVAPSPEYTRQQDDLIKTIDIPLKIALFGGSLEVPTLHKEVKLKIPSGVKNNQKFRIKEYGAFNRKNNSKGDLYLQANVILPPIESLSDTLKDLLEKEL
ncbi:DnaJ family protein [Helicobacter enhydrae]|uniref:DnaJ family protein n=1 Tax=Helicobacter enhydrae TaxID=222136 RepID=A0A1B1U4S7_9HELI|nr:J domain-containing protein [Helicobacter enhydrae]ANV97773.1 DnaJ family protein [Helicobacter enhydrae]